jgi:hypothetical protein
MSCFTLKIELGNEAMQTGTDVSEALQRLSSKLYDYGDLEDCSGVIMDLNGNRVGSWKVVEE